jgi:hypothetical protein
MYIPGHGNSQKHVLIFVFQSVPGNCFDQVLLAESPLTLCCV